MSLEERHRELRAFFDRAAPGWAARPFDADLARTLVAGVGLRAGDRVVDLGGGTGKLLPILRQAVGESGRVCGVDLSAGMLRLAEALAGASGSTRVCAVAEALPLRNDGWDAVICLGVFPHFSDRTGALREINRSLRPGGRMVILHLIGRDRLNALHGRLGPPVDRDLLPGDGEVARGLEEAGFRVLEVCDMPEWYRVVAQRPG